MTRSTYIITDLRVVDGTVAENTYDPTLAGGTLVTNDTQTSGNLKITSDRKAFSMLDDPSWSRNRISRAQWPTVLVVNAFLIGACVFFRKRILA